MIKQEKNWLIHSLIGILGKPNPVVPTQRKILFNIALSGKPQTKYCIEKETKINHASVYEAVTTLENQGVIKSTETQSRNPKQTMREYCLTRYGAFLTIEQLHFWPFNPKDRNKIGKVAEKWNLLEPVIFGKWKYFEQELGTGVGIAFLVFAAFTSDKCEDLEDDRYNVISECFEQFGNMIDQYYNAKNDPKEMENYLKWAGPNPETSLDNWVKTIRNDPDLNKYLMQYLEDIFELTKARLRWSQYLNQGPEYASKWLVF
jgi:DNA-binding PadR family transcriptional regulator